MRYNGHCPLFLYALFNLHFRWIAGTFGFAVEVVDKLMIIFQQLVE